MVNEHTTLGALAALLQDRGWRLALRTSPEDGRYVASVHATHRYAGKATPVLTRAFGVSPVLAIAGALESAEAGTWEPGGRGS